MKISKIVAVALAAHLFELEIDSITQNPDFHFQFNGWMDKFGEDCIKQQEKLTSDKYNQFNAEAISKLAEEIQGDFASGYWAEPENKKDGLYNYLMPSQYCGHIVPAIEKQLAILTGVGIQTELQLN